MLGDTVLFGRSRVRRAILGRFFSRPGLERHGREFARELGYAPQPVARELRALERAGILTSAMVGRARRYRVNERSPIAPQISALVRRTIGVEAKLKEALQDLPGVEEAFIYGSYARGADRATSDIDVMVIGPVSRRTLSERLRSVESDLGRDVNVTRYSSADVRRLRRSRDRFLADVMSGKRILLVSARPAT